MVWRLSPVLVMHTILIRLNRAQPAVTSFLWPHEFRSRSPGMPPRDRAGACAAFAIRESPVGHSESEREDSTATNAATEKTYLGQMLFME